jgi:hypothetical protein
LERDGVGVVYLLDVFDQDSIVIGDEPTHFAIKLNRRGEYSVRGFSGAEVDDMFRRQSFASFETLGINLEQLVELSEESN